ncbi:MAG TPA: MraY family glycosyltransferase [bacterium]|nr:MraY family glycosyltransferase [bacterium]HOL48253.1 MraY family glycosyltransferase [bacterium]HPQ19366.1 MraY family glycosyltransferase [bacterium]
MCSEIYNKEFFYISILSFFISFSLMPVIRRIAFYFKILDIPNQRKIHTQPIPLLGGASILITIFISFFIYYYYNSENFTGKEIQTLVVIGIGAIFIFIVGLIDDIKHIKPMTKLFCQIILALFVTIAGVRTSLFTQSIILNVIISSIWIVGITNAFNLLDNMDGLSSGVAFISCILFSLVAYFQNNFLNSLITLIIAFSILGFIPYNFNPAKIFLGDCGSLLIGYLISVIGITGVYLEKSLLTRLPIITPLIILAIPIYDTLSVIIIRKKLGLSIFNADKRHFSHRLVNLGLSVKQAVLLIYLLTAANGIIALLLPHIARIDAIIILIHSILMFLIIAIFEWISYKKLLSEKNNTTN